MDDLDDLVADMDAAAVRVAAGTRSVVKKGAQVVKTRLQAEADGVRHAPSLPSAITYDVTSGPDGLDAEIGPTRGGTGSLAFLYFGNSKTGPVLPDPVLAADAEADVVAEHLAALGGDL